MAEAVHLFGRNGSQTASSGTTPAEIIDFTAAELSGAGFANSDKALIVSWGIFGNALTSATLFKVLYNGSALTNAATPRLSLGAAGIQRHMGWFHVLDLSTLAELSYTVESSGVNNGLCEKGELKAVRMTDLGTENTDWHYNHNTDLQTDTTTFTNRAAVTFTPDEVTDWIVLGYNQVNAEGGNDRQSEARIRLDGATTVFGTISQEPKATGEELPWLYWGRINALSAASHTVSIQHAGESGTTNQHRESKILVFKANKFTDVFTDIVGTVSLPTATDTQIATLTSSVSVNQDSLLFGTYMLDTDTGDDDSYIWVRQGGSTVIPPVVNTSTGFSNNVSADATDDMLTSYVTDLALTSGAQDLDLFASHSDGSTLNALTSRFLLWGMNLDEEAPEGTGASTLDGVTSAGSGTTANQATGTSTLGGVTSAGTGIEGFPSTGATTLGGVTSAGAGLVAIPVSGTGATTLGGVTSAGAGTTGVTATGTSLLDGVTPVGSGLIANPVTGTGSSTLQGVTSSGSGLVLVAGKIENVVCDLIGVGAVCDEYAPAGACDLYGPVCVSSITP